MAQFYSDSHISYALLRALADLGHDVLKCQDIDQQDASDHEHLWFAAHEDRIFITSDHGFKLWSDAWVYWSRQWSVDHPHRGILIIPVPNAINIVDCVSSIDRYVAVTERLHNRWHELTDDRARVVAP